MEGDMTFLTAFIIAFIWASCAIALIFGGPTIRWRASDSATVKIGVYSAIVIGGPFFVVAILINKALSR
jgi:hypothetical protein